MVAEATKQRRDTCRPLSCSRSLGWKWPDISGRGSSRTASWRRMRPAISTSSASVPPQWSAKPDMVVTVGDVHRSGATRVRGGGSCRRLRLPRQAAAAMVGEARVMVADDPHPVEPRGHALRAFARGGGQPVAAEAVVEAVAEAIEPAGAGALDLALPARSASRANRRAAGTARAARTSSLSRGAGRRPAAPAAPASRARRRAGGEVLTSERKGNHEPP